MRKILLLAVLLIVAVLAFVAGSRFAHDENGSAVGKAKQKILYYTDPMNPGFRSDKPGIAPCGMPLEPVYAEPGGVTSSVALGSPPPSPGTVDISPLRQQLIGVQLRQVSVAPLTSTLRLYGRVSPDEEKVHRVNLATGSWVRWLPENITTGSLVSKDQLLAEVLDSEYYDAQSTYLAALTNWDLYQNRFGVSLAPGQVDYADSQMRNALQELQDLGLSEMQIQELAKTRKAMPLLQVRAPLEGVVLRRNLSLNQWVAAGEELYRIADLDTVWIYADISENEAVHLRPGIAAQVRLPQTGASFPATVSKVLPLFEPEARTLRVRLDVANPRYDLRPDMFVDVEIPVSLPPSLHVPADAVVDTGTMQIVYVAAGNGTFEPRRVETGWRLDREVEITGGLMEGEAVVVAGNFLIDSESRMKTAAAGLRGARSRDPVCGMEVDEEAAKHAGNTHAHGDRTYYFCKTQCRDAFVQEPDKYAGGAMAGDPNGHDPAGGQAPDWRAMLAPRPDEMQAMPSRDNGGGEAPGMEQEGPTDDAQMPSVPPAADTAMESSAAGREAMAMPTHDHDDHGRKVLSPRVAPPVHIHEPTASPGTTGQAQPPGGR